MWKRIIGSVGLIASLACTDANADTILFANLTPLAEIITEPPTSGTPVGPGGVLKPFLTSTDESRPQSSGTAVFVLNDAQTALSMTATIFNIDVTGTQTPDDTNDDLVAAHIHSGVVQSTDTRGVEARAITWGFFGMPDNDDNPDQLVITPFASGVGGTFTSVWDAPEGNEGTSLGAQVPNLLAGLAYINFHTNQFRSGEIRGTLQVQVPEPSSIALLALALGGIYVANRRRRA
jgi:hypothetical protein